MNDQTLGQRAGAIVDDLNASCYLDWGHEGGPQISVQARTRNFDAIVKLAIEYAQERVAAVHEEYHDAELKALRDDDRLWWTK